MVLGIFKIALRLRDQQVFMWQPLENLNLLTTLSLELIFWNTETFFKKLEYCILVQSINIESAMFPHKTNLPAGNVKTEREVQNGPTTKDGVLSVTTLFFWTFCFRVKTSSKEIY